jgi:hypothetical protein
MVLERGGAGCNHIIWVQQQEAGRELNLFKTTSKEMIELIKEQK